MPNRRGRSRRSRGQRRSSQRANGYYIEVFTFSVQAGNTANVTVATLADRPPRSNFRPRWMEVEFSSFVPGTATLPASFTPVAFQFSLDTGSNSVGLPNSDATSRLRLASTTPRVQRITNPVSADWYSWNQGETTLVATLSAVCIGLPAGSGSTSFVRGVCRLHIDVQIEVSATSCPALSYVEAHDVSSEIIPLIPSSGPRDETPSRDVVSAYDVPGPSSVCSCLSDVSFC